MISWHKICTHLRRCVLPCRCICKRSPFIYLIPGIRDTNVALNRPCTHISSYSDNEGPAVCERAVDGDTSSDFADGSCTHTLSEHHAWWAVDLGQSYFIDRVTVYNRDRGGKQNKIYKGYILCIGC